MGTELSLSTRLLLAAKINRGSRLSPAFLALGEMTLNL